MKTDIDLKQMERRVYTRFFEDGLWDLLLAVFLLGWGLMVDNSLFVPFAATLVVMYPAIWGIKRWLTYPRLGYVKFSSDRKAEEKRVKTKMTVMFSATMVLGIAVFALTASRNIPLWLIQVVFGGVLASVVGLLAYWLQVKHWYGYAILILTTFTLVSIIDIHLKYSFFITGGAVAISGIFLLVRFLRKYPRLEEENPDGR